jgi:hypothetical protein
MPSSDPATIPKVLSLVSMLNPRRILDVGAGNGRYGFLFRECLDLNYARFSKEQWQVVIEGLELDAGYLSPVHQMYTSMYVGDWNNFAPKRYDIIFMGDVLEHFEDWQSALQKARAYSAVTIVVSPNWPGSMAQKSWHGHDQEEHKVALSPEKVGGRCVYANSKIFMSVFDNNNIGAFDGKDFLL